ncbi:four helix bundle protein [Sandaracinomonas limnophila]|uniref:Four helix bundle protein n=1 Tax=Sandaracinomonas limnophila TaxID=1862386 RepID=A0A437PTR8_9BACT|nr:four helix bundle protein [Sandaracinomonas limnophila]RVU25620.1 four helix bundle protein [Sandaracinomonas limnophila]
MKQNIIKDKSSIFAIEIVKFCEILFKNKEFIISNQLKKSGTSIGAQIREAEHAQSKADFVNKLSIAQKETNETIYWLEILYNLEFTDKEEIQKLQNSVIELLKILTSIIKSSKKNLKH